MIFVAVTLLDSPELESPLTDPVPLNEKLMGDVPRTASVAIAFTELGDNVAVILLLDTLPHVAVKSAAHAPLHTLNSSANKVSNFCFIIVLFLVCI